MNDPVTLVLLLYLLKELDVVFVHRWAMRVTDNKDCVFLRHSMVWLDELHALAVCVAKGSRRLPLLLALYYPLF